MKRSISAPLLLLGSIALSACGQSHELTQQVYKSKEDCEQDWNDGQSCSQSSGGSSHGSGGRWSGPRYYWDRDLEKPVAINADGSERVISGSRITPAASGIASGHGEGHATGSVSRGGFGSIAHGFSFGG